MKRTLLLFVVLVLGVGGLRAQHFEWAKGYSSSQEGNRIVGSVTDSAGNLYILGNFRNDASWDGGSHLLPMAPYGPYTNVYNLLIAKITPDGTMAWKKVIHANNGKGATPYDIKMVGDSAFTCLLDFVLPYEGYNYCYYLDTLLTTTSDYPVPNGNMSYASRTAFITFDFEGHVLEQHFLTITYLDNDGNDLMRHYDPPITPSDWYINATGNYQSTFDVDADGNVYFCRIANDFIDQTYATWLGTIGGIKYWVDGRVVGQVEVQNNPLMWYPQLLKFSPHMDTLLASRYLVQRCDTNIDYGIRNLFLKLDHEGNPYVVETLTMSERVNNIITLDSVLDYSFFHTFVNRNIPYLVKLDPMLHIHSVVQMEDSVIHPNLSNSTTNFWDISFDEDSSLLFLTGCTGRGSFGDTTNFYSILKCQGVPLLNLKNDAFFIAFRVQNDTLAFYSYGYTPSLSESNLLTITHNNISCKNNRVFFQPMYYGGVRHPGNIIQLSNRYESSLGLEYFDYQGRLIGGVHYEAMSPDNKPGPIALRDSILYLSNYLVTGATFGDIHMPAQGYNACIAKYVDTSFLTPYIYVPDTDSIGLPEVEPDLLYVYPNPAHGKLFLSVGDEQITGVYLTTLMGQRKPVLFSNGMVSLSGFPAGMYFIEVITNKNKYHKKIIIL